MSNKRADDDPRLQQPHVQLQQQKQPRRQRTPCVDPAWNYRALSVLDVLLHVFVVSNLAIGAWAGSYQLFVIYHEVFNPWLATGSAVAVQLDGTGSWLYVLDSFFSVCIIGSLVVIVWRGVWNIMDQYLGETEAVLALVIGYSIVLTAFALQPVVKKLVNKVEGLKRIITVDVYLMFSFVGAVNVWRGVWIMLDKYFINDAPITGYWISHIACFGFLVLLNSSNSILVRGVYIDAEEDGTQCVDFPCYYVRLLVQKRKRRKERPIEDEGKEMTQIKVGMEEKTGDPNEKILLTSENGDITKNEIEETLNKQHRPKIV